MSKKYTIRDVEPKLDRAVREESAHYGISLNKTLLRLLARALGLTKETEEREAMREPIVLKPWERREAEGMRKSLGETREVDPDLWK